MQETDPLGSVSFISFLFSLSLLQFLSFPGLDPFSSLKNHYSQIITHIFKEFWELIFYDAHLLIEV